MDLEVFRLDRKVERCWALMPQLRARVHTFGTRGRHGNIDQICLSLEATFLGIKCPTPCVVCSAGTEHMACWFVVRVDTQTIVGHVLAAQDIFNGGKVTFVLQAEADPSVVPLDMQRMIHFELEQWSAATQHVSVPEILMLTPRFRLRAWKKMFGYRLYRGLMRWDPALMRPSSE